MGKITEMKTIESPGQFLEWLNENDLLLRINRQEAKLLLGYLEGHGYRLDTDGTDLMLVDLQVQDEPELILIDDVIDRVMEWNYEMISQTREEMEKSDNDSDFLQKQKHCDILRKDEKVLDRLFDQTYYGKEIKQLTETLAMEFIGNMQKQGMDTAVKGLSGEIIGSETEGRCR